MKVTKEDNKFLRHQEKSSPSFSPIIMIHCMSKSSCKRCSTIIKESSLLYIFFVILVFCHESCGLSSAIKSCGEESGMNIGGMTPDTQIKNGSSFSIICKLFRTEARIKGRMQRINSNNIVFDFNGNRIPRERITIEDEMTASLNFEFVNVSDSGVYWCSIETHSSVIPSSSLQQSNPSSRPTSDLSLTTVCSMHLEVGLPPRDIGIDRMFCIAPEYENLTCSWTPPDYNVRTNYTIRYYYGEKTGTSGPCPIPRGTSCTWTLSSEPHYRQFSKKFQLLLQSENIYGRHKEIFTIKNFEIIRPGVVEEFAVTDVTFDGFNLSWNVPHGFDFGSMPHENTATEPKLIYQIEVEPVFQFENEADDTKDEQEIPSRMLFSTRSHSLRVKEGILPNTEYRIRIRSQTVDSKNDTFWSPWLMNKTVTASAVPFRSPTVHQTFHSVVYGDKKRNVTIYWQPLRHWETNGPGFFYEVKVEAAPSIWMLSRSSQQSVEHDLVGLSFTKRVPSYTDSSVVLVGLHAETSYRITVFSANDKGSSSTNRSILTYSSSLVVATESNANGLSVLLEEADQMSFSLSSEQQQPSDEVSSLDSVKPISVEVFFYGRSEYEVRWNHPRRLHSGHCESYTISWCPNDRLDEENGCTGVMRTQVFPANGSLTADTIDMITQVNVSDNRHYQFGVSSNFRIYPPSMSPQRLTSYPYVIDGLLLSSGLSWASCVIPINIKKLEKIHAFHAKAVNHTAIKLSWKLPCQGLQSVITKYEISYCETNMNHTCQMLNNSAAFEIQIEVLGGNHRQLIIYDLKPETLYRFVIRAWTTETPGEESEVIVEMTSSVPSSVMILLLEVVFVMICVLLTCVIMNIGWKKYRKFQDEIRVPIELPGKFANPSVKLSELNRNHFNNRSHENDDEDQNNSLPLKIHDGMITVTTDSDSMDGMIFSASRLDKNMFHTDSGQGTDSSSESSDHLVSQSDRRQGLDALDFSGSSFPDEQETSFVSSIEAQQYPTLPKFSNPSRSSRKEYTGLSDNKDYGTSDISFPATKLLMKNGGNLGTNNRVRSSPTSGYIAHKDMMLANSKTTFPAPSKRESKENSFSDHHITANNRMVIPLTSSQPPSNGIISISNERGGQSKLNPISVTSSSLSTDNSHLSHSLHGHPTPVSVTSTLTGRSIVSPTGTSSPLESLPFSSPSTSSSNSTSNNSNNHFDKNASFYKGSNGYVFLPSQVPLTRI